MKHSLHRWLPVTLWMAAIYLVSAQPEIPRAPDPTLDYLVKKLLHATAYAILAVLWYRSLTNRDPLVFSRRSDKVLVAWNRRAAILALLLSIAYAGTDEWHQQRVPGRHGVPQDVGIDTAGALAGLALVRRRAADAQTT